MPAQGPGAIATSGLATSSSAPTFYAVPRATCAKVLVLSRCGPSLKRTGLDEALAPFKSLIGSDNDQVVAGRSLSAIQALRLYIWAAKIWSVNGWNNYAKTRFQSCPGWGELPLRNIKKLALGIGALAAVTATVLTPPVAADTQQDCFGPDGANRIEACSRLLELPLPPLEKSYAFAMRALAHSLQGRYEMAIPDYDRAIEISPDFAVALNNRAWAYFKSGQPRKAEPDVARALELSPMSPHALDTRAHVRQSLGDLKGALKDYNAAMRYGGARMVKLYQCGLQAHGLYDGVLSGIVSEKLRGALETCVKNRGCDPLPADEECRRLTS